MPDYPQNAAPLTVAMVEAVKRHAAAHYETGGWDIVVEAFDDAQIAEIIGRAWTPKGAIAKVAFVVNIHNQHREDIRGTAF